MNRRPVPILLLVVLALAACGASQREKTLKASLVAVNAARDGFIAYDLEHQRSLVKKATTRDEAVAAVAAYREKREPILELFVAAYRAIGVAAVLSDDEPSLQAALAAVGKLRDALAELMGGAP